MKLLSTIHIVEKSHLGSTIESGRWDGWRGLGGVGFSLWVGLDGGGVIWSPWVGLSGGGVVWSPLVGLGDGGVVWSVGWVA